MDDFALSTAWNASGHKDGTHVIDEIKDCGFDSVELNFTLTSRMVGDISSIVKKGGIKVRSLHNYCPIPEGLKQNEASPDYYSLASLDKDERRMAIHYTKRTIEEAATLGAKAVVLHCGKVNSPDYTRKLIELYEKGKKDCEEFTSIKDKMFSERRSNSKLHIDTILTSLGELNAYAEKKRIMLGVENRFYFTEIPSLEEIGLILEEFRGSAIYYWHDAGHAQVFEELGFAGHKDYLNNYSGSMVGIHLHDIKGCHDHLAPGRGSLDFSIFKPYIRTDTLKIIEAHKTASTDDIKRAKAYLENIFKEGA